jgi:hypothetical protein
MTMEYTKAATLEMESQAAIHGLDEDEKETVDVMARQFAEVLFHDRISPADVRYAASVVAIRRAGVSR